MQGLGARLKARARQLGWTDVDVARLVGVSQGRYSSWVNDVHEPDFGSLVRVAAALRLSTDEILGVQAAGGDEDAALRERAAVALRALAGRDLERVVAVVEKLAEMDGSGKAEPN